MGRRARRREKEGGSAAKAGTPASFADLGVDLELGDVHTAGELDLRLDEDHGVLTLRTGMSPGTRSEYAALLKGDRSPAAAGREDTWHRALEFLFERLATRWEIAGVATTGQADLLKRLRVSTPAERIAVRDGLREHIGAHFPDIEAP